jgi:hypothetical protein
VEKEGSGGVADKDIVKDTFQFNFHFVIVIMMMMMDYDICIGCIGIIFIIVLSSQLNDGEDCTETMMSK